MLYKITHGSFKSNGEFTSDTIELSEKEALLMDPSGDCLMPNTKWEALQKAEKAKAEIIKQAEAGEKPKAGGGK